MEINSLFNKDEFIYIFTDFVMVFVPKTHAKIYYFIIIVATGLHPWLHIISPFQGLDNLL